LASASLKSGSMAASGAKQPFIRKQHPVTDQLESGSGRGRLTVPSGEPRHQCFGGICEHRGVRRSCFHPVRAERRRSVGDQCDVTPTPSRLRRRISRYFADSAGCRTWRDSNHSKHCYAADWGIACSTNRKNRVLRVPATNFIYPTSRPLSVNGLLAFVANDRCRPDGCADLRTAFTTVINAAFSPRGNAPSD
jgi:hypothetical protein